MFDFYARKQLLAFSARINHRNSVLPSVRMSACHTGGSVKTVQAKIGHGLTIEGATFISKIISAVKIHGK